MRRHLLFALIVLASALPAAAAEYRVTFDATWSAATHPTAFPADPHWSWLIGGVHGPDVSFWDVDSLASLGMERMAEWGSITPLDEEVQAAVDAGTALTVLEGDWLPTSPGSTFLDFTATDLHSRVTLVTMIAPSPDWFAGVSGLELRPGGTWVDSLTVALLPLDAGTDAGTGYTSGNSDTVPHLPIGPVGAPFSPGVPVGTFTFVRTDPVTDAPAAVLSRLTAHPNPFNPRTTFRFRLTADGPVELTLFDLRGHLVARLLDGTLAAGEHIASWDGRDDQGTQRSAGSYVARLTTGAGVTTRKVSLVK